MALHSQHAALMRTTSLYGLFRTDFKNPMNIFHWIRLGLEPIRASKLEGDEK